MQTIGSETVSATQRGELASLSLELQRELARLEQLPWPSGRVFVSRNDERPPPAYAPVRFPTRVPPRG